MLADAYAEGRDDVEKGIAILDDGLERTPDHPNILFMRGFLLSLLARYDESRAWYEKSMAGAFQAEQHSMVDDEIWIWKAPLNIATTYVKESRVEEAIPWFERAQANKPDSPVLRGLVASAYERVGRYYDAERMFREAAERDGDAGFMTYVNYLMRRRRFFEAFDRVEHRRDAVDDRAYAALLISAAQTTRDERLGDPEPYARRALELVPGDGLALGLLESLYASRGETVNLAALRAAEMDAALASPADYSRRSHRLLEEQRLDDALAVAREGLALAPHDGVLAYNAALAAARLRRDDEALAHLDAISRDDAHATSSLALRAEIQRRAGDLDAAVATLERVRTLAAPDETALRHATLGLATALLEAGRVADAGKLAAFVLN